MTPQINLVAPQLIAVPAAVDRFGYDADFNLVLLASYDSLAQAILDASSSNQIVVNDATSPGGAILVTVDQLFITAPVGFVATLTLATGINYISTAGDADFTVIGNAGQNMIFGSVGNDSFYGGGLGDYIEGWLGNDLLDGGDGNDTLTGWDDNDTLFGGAGADEMIGGLGDDLAFGGDGNDTITGGIGKDTLEGGVGADSLMGDAGVDFLIGLDGNDILQGGAGNDSMNGGAHNDLLQGGTGADSMDGGLGTDTLAGGADNDVLIGGDGADRLLGGDDNDTLRGGIGRDALFGEAGADVFVWSTVAEAGNLGTRDRVLDFEHGVDKLDFSAIQAGQTWVGGLPFSGTAGEIRFNVVAGLIAGDLDGDRVADFQIIVTGGVFVSDGDVIL